LKHEVNKCLLVLGTPNSVISVINSYVHLSCFQLFDALYSFAEPHRKLIHSVLEGENIHELSQRVDEATEDFSREINEAIKGFVNDFIVNNLGLS